jgi:hypothetical protein
MVGRASSDTKKRQVSREAEDRLCAQAVEAYRDELAKPAGVKWRSACKIAGDFMSLYKQETRQDITLDNSYLCQHADKGTCTWSEANAAKSWLTKEEVEVVIEYVIECGDWGFPLSHRRLQEHVNEILQVQLGDKFPEGGVGKKWTNQLIEKHSCCLKTPWSTPLESKHGHAVNENTSNAFYNLLDGLIKKYHLIPKNMYGTDKVRTNPVNGERECVIGWKSSGPQYQQ